MPTIKISKSVLKKAKKEAKSNGSIQTKNIRQNKKSTTETINTVKSQLRQEKKKSGGVKWNINTGDLAWITSAGQEKSMGYVLGVSNEQATNLKDWRQSVIIMTNSGLTEVHPKFIKVIQKV